jgi:hypothetical protein
MSTFGLVLSLHVVTAILGVGLVSGMLVLSLAMDASTPATTWTSVDRMRRTVGVSLGVVLASGALLEVLAGGPFHGTLWFRASFVLLLLLGALGGVTGRTIRKRTDIGAETAVRRLRAAASAMCVVVAMVATLMEVKP